MYPANQSVKDAMYSPSRSIKGTVTFDITDVTAYDDVSAITSTPQTSFTDETQVTNKKRTPNYKLATYEDGMFSLDGSVTFPDSVPANNGETGFVSDGLSDVNGSFGVRYIRDWLDGSDKNTSNHWVEIQAFDSNGLNVALNKNITYTGTAHNTNFSAVTDGDITSSAYLDINAGINNVTVDLGDLYDITSVKVWHYYADGRTYHGTKTEVSSDGVNWITVFDSAVSGEYVEPSSGHMMNVDLPQPQLTIEFNSTHSSAGITVTFDSLLGEYATDFDVIAYDAAGNVIDSVSVTGNTEIIHQALGQLANYKKLVITIKKWCKPYRRARIIEVDFGIVRVYDDDKLITMGYVEELDLTSAQIPSAEFSFQVDNQDRVFNILNPTGFYKYLQQRQKVYVDFFVDVNGTLVTVPLGQFFLYDWTSDEGSLTASFKARTALDLMSAYSYENKTAATKSLSAIAQELFSICGITDYEIDPSLDTINSTNSLVDTTDCKTALHMVVIAGRVNVWVDRNGVVKLVKEDTIGAAVDAITFDNTYSEPKIQLEKIIKTVNVSYWTDLNTSIAVSVNDPNVDTGGSLTVDENTLIDSSSLATDVANWVLSQSNNRRAHYTIDFRGNPLLELGDAVSIENSYGTDKVAIITKNDFQYQGYLKSNTEARGLDS